MNSVPRTPDALNAIAPGLAVQYTAVLNDGRDPEQLLTLARQLPEVCRRVRAQDIGPHAVSRKPLLVRRVLLDDGRTAVLKLTGGDHSFEFAGLHQWYWSNRPVAEPVAWGVDPGFIVTVYNPGRPLAGSDIATRLEDIAGQVRRLHDVPPPSAIRHLGGWVERQVHASVGVMLISGMKVPMPGDIMRAMPVDGDAFVHGDLLPRSLLALTPNVLFVSPHPGVGAAEYDFATLVVSAAAPDATHPAAVANFPERLKHLRARMLSAAPTADPVKLDRFIAQQILWRLGHQVHTKEAYPDLAAALVAEAVTYLRGS